jgi:MPBQ/MSBQ methyltransferase
MGIVKKLLNPVNWVKAYSFNKKNKKYDRSTYDLELHLYSQMLRNDMLHLGYFEDVNTTPESISIDQIEASQITYANKIIEQIVLCNKPILDVGCGMGGLATKLLEKDLTLEVLTPNKKQIEYINKEHPKLIAHNVKFEDLKSSNTFGTIINSESLQYIRLDDAFDKIDTLLDSDGRWIVVDFFRLSDNSKDKSGHLLQDFTKLVSDRGYKIVHEQDITPNVIPMLKYIDMYVTRILLPLQHYGYEKLRFKKGWLYFLTKELRENIDKKIEKERASIQPEMFFKEKKYLLYVLKKN